MRLLSLVDCTVDKNKEERSSAPPHFMISLLQFQSVLIVNTQSEVVQCRRRQSDISILDKGARLGPQEFRYVGTVRYI